MAKAQTAAASFEIKTADWEDVKYAFRKGVADFGKHPFLSLFFGLVYVIGGLLIFYGLYYVGEVWLIIPLAIGFPLIAPFVAAGVYDISRRIEKGEPVTFRAVLTVVWQQRAREMAWMAFTMLFIFWIWIYQVRLLLAIFLSRLSFSSLDRSMEMIFLTSDGWTFLAVGTLVGTVLATALFSVTVTAMPMLLDRDVDFITAMITSVRSVLQSRFVMLAWGAIIGGILLVSMVPAFLGLALALPILGHASWHLYRRLIV